MTPTLCVNGVVTFMMVTGDDTNTVCEGVVTFMMVTGDNNNSVCEWRCHVYGGNG